MKPEKAARCRHLKTRLFKVDKPPAGWKGGTNANIKKKKKIKQVKFLTSVNPILPLGTSRECLSKGKNTGQMGKRGTENKMHKGGFIRVNTSHTRKVVKQKSILKIWKLGRRGSYNQRPMQDTEVKKN